MKNSKHLSKYLIRSKWIKKNNEEIITFLDQGRILYENLSSKEIRIDEYYVISNSQAVIKWTIDSFISIIDFNEQLSEFIENRSKEFSWRLVSLEFKNLNSKKKD